MNQTQSYQRSTSHTSAKCDVLGLPGYTPLMQLAHGAQADVFLAKRDRDGLRVAIKRLNIESVKTWKTYELFHREAEVLSTLDIDGIAKFYEAVDMPDGKPPRAFIVQEFIPGTTLGTLIGQGHRLSLSSVFDIIVQLLELLKQLHSHVPPVIHRDIKPSNIMLKPLENDRYKVYLLDFGAVANPQLQGGGSTVAGTPGFMPPEQLMGKPIPACDVYAVAAVAVNLITGISPMAMPVKDFHLIFEPQMQFMPVNVVNVLRQMLEPDSENRLSDYDVLIDTFKRFRGGNYDTFDATGSYASDVDYDVKLKLVQSYAQDGNIELWQRLPDKTPRNIPKIYQDRFDAILKLSDSKDENNRLYFGKKSDVYMAQFDQNKANYDTKFEVHGKGDSEFGAGDVVVFICALLAPVVFFGGIFLSDEIGILENHIGSVFVLLFFLILLVAVGGPILILSLIPKRLASRRALKYDGFSRLVERKSAAIDIQNLLKNGRKTIATIVSVQYENANKELIERNVETYQFVVHHPPRFKVQYRFNPPDDRDANDLIHTIWIGEPTETFLKEGDPLPILYRIYQSEDGEHVDSMPFPIVLKDLESLSGVLGHSTYRLAQ